MLLPWLASDLDSGITSMNLHTCPEYFKILKKKREVSIHKCLSLTEKKKLSEKRGMELGTVSTCS
jgi:hypothetical protein